MQIFLVRHAQSIWQLEPSHDWDTALTPTGHQQAKHLGKWLASRPWLDSQRRVEIHAICTSPMVRARETATYLADLLQLPLELQEDLREARFHVAEHLPSAPEPFAQGTSYQVSATYAMFKEQVLNAFRWLVEQAEVSGGLVLAITHGGLIKTLLRLAVDSDAVCFKLYNTGLNVIEWRRGRWHLVHLNLWDHLPPELRTH